MNSLMEAFFYFTIIWRIYTSFQSKFRQLFVAFHRMHGKQLSLALQIWIGGIINFLAFVPGVLRAEW